MHSVSKVWIFCSVLIGALVLLSSLLGIFDPVTYAQESANWAMQAVGQDIGNLLAVPVLLVSTYFLTKKSVAAWLVWLGTLLYFIYAFLIYAFFVHFNYLFLVYVAILGLSAYSVIVGLLGQDLAILAKSVVGKRFRGASVLLMLTGGLFALLWLSEIIPALISGDLPKSIATAGLWVNPIQVIDLSLVLSAMILIGVLLWRKKTLGYVFAAPWLVFSVLMGSSIVATLFLDLRTGNAEAVVPLAMVGLLVVASVIVVYCYLKIF